ncbi:MAG: hypothetical protein WAL30_05865, partial [Candidatus Aquirickettsiella sp.]
GFMPASPSMTLRRDAFPASPVNARLSRAPRLRTSFSPCLVVRVKEKQGLSRLSPISERGESTIHDWDDIEKISAESVAALEKSSQSQQGTNAFFTNKTNKKTTEGHQAIIVDATPKLFKA